MTQPIKKILIAGGGTAGWMTAAALASILENKCRITLVESEDIGTVGVGEATIPVIRSFNRTLGIDESDFLKATNGSYKLGIEFVNWHKEGSKYFHPFGTHGRDFDLNAVHQHWLRAHKIGFSLPFDELSMAWQAAKENRFVHPAQDPRDVLSTYEYAYHFDAGLYAKFLRTYSETRGIKRVEGKIQDVSLNSESGFVESIKLDNGDNLDADMFVDCTGFRALLINGALKEPFEDWGKWLVCDSAVIVGSKRLDPLPPYTRSTAHAAGWQWRIPLQHRTGNGHVYSSKYMDADTAEKILVDNLPTKMTGEPLHLRFKTGIRRNQWKKNVVAIGLASGFMEPLESTSIHMIQANISKLLAYFPDKSFDPSGIKEFNYVAQVESERIRDFLILHYILNDRPENMWKYCKSMDIPETLALKMEHFTKYGRLIPRDKDIFGTDSWLAVQLGQKNIPESIDPLLSARDVDSREFLRKLHNALKVKANTLPTHGQLIAQQCPAIPDK